MHTGIFHTHKLVVILFLAIYLIKTILLLINKNDALTKFTKIVKVPEMIISFLFLATGIYLIIQAPEVSILQIIKLIAVFASIPLAVIGFKKANKALAILSLLLIITAYGLAEINKKKKAGTAIAAIDGKEIYETKCMACHGAEGNQGVAGAKDLTITPLDDAGIKEIITNGKNTMSGFSTVLNEEQINSVAAYVQRLKKQ